MPSLFHLTEPFPNPTRQYAFTGRGGAGNITRQRPATTITEPSKDTTAINNLCLIQSAAPYPPPRGGSIVSTSTRPSRLRKTYTFGRGGFGNCHPAAERAMFSFDEELERAGKAAESMAPIYHIGRGGQGNIVYDSDASSSGSSSISSSSAGSTGRGLKSSLDKVRAHFSRQNSYNN